MTRPPTTSNNSSKHRKSSKQNLQQKDDDQETPWKKRFSAIITLPSLRKTMTQLKLERLQINTQPSQNEHSTINSSDWPLSEKNLRLQQKANDQPLKFNLGGERALQEYIKDGQEETTFKEPSDKLQTYISKMAVQGRILSASPQREINYGTLSQTNLNNNYQSTQNQKTSHQAQILNSTFQSYQFKLEQEDTMKDEQEFAKDLEDANLLEEKFKPIKYTSIKIVPKVPRIQIDKDVNKPLDILYLEQNRKKLIETMMCEENKDQRINFNRDLFNKIKQENLEEIKTKFLEIEEKKRYEQHKKVIMSRKYADQVAIEIRFLPRKYREKLQKKLKWYVAENLNMNLEIDKNNLKGCKVDFKEALDDYFKQNVIR